MFGSFLLPLLQAASAASAIAPVAPDARAREAFHALSAGERKDLLDFLALELEQRGLFQVELLHFVLRLPGRDPASYAEEPAPSWFDPELHAPAQPIPRKLLAPDDARVVGARKELFAKQPARALRSAFHYDYGRREVLRAKNWDDAERVFANALAGYAPNHDLAEARVEALLDDGALQPHFAAFGNAYTDRLGNVYPGITLFDAWASGAEIEMPDIDTLGILHVLKDDWKSFQAPVDGRRQKPLYDKIGAFYLEASRHRVLRRALTLCYLEGQPELPGGYEGVRSNLHLAWEKAHSTPAELLATLPTSATWKEYLAALGEEGRAKVELSNAAELRQRTLASAALAVRAAALAALEEFGAYKKLEPATPKEH